MTDGTGERRGKVSGRKQRRKQRARPSGLPRKHRAPRGRKRAAWDAAWLAEMRMLVDIIAVGHAVGVVTHAELADLECDRAELAALGVPLPWPAPAGGSA